MSYPLMRFAGWLTAIMLGMSTMHTAADIKIGIIQTPQDDARKFKPLVDYLKTKGIDGTLTAETDYTETEKNLANGQLDAMFSGAGVAGIMMIKELAKPTVRPVSAEGYCGYWAVVVAPKDAPRYGGNGGYFEGKRVALAALASSGEIYYRAIVGNGGAHGATVIKVASHDAALDAVNRGLADVAIVENRVWRQEKANYTDLAMVGEDTGENPDNTLIVSTRLDGPTVNKLIGALIAMNEDRSPAAREARSSLGIKSFLPTSSRDFAHTLSLLAQAGVNKSFDFTFR